MNTKIKSLWGNFSELDNIQIPYIILKNQAAKILEYALEFSHSGVAMLLRLTFLEPCKNRADLLKYYADNLVAIIPVNPRPKFRKDTSGSDSSTVAWFEERKDWSWSKQNINCPFIFENQWNS